MFTVKCSRVLSVVDVLVTSSTSHKCMYLKTEIFGALICMKVHQNSMTNALSKFNSFVQLREIEAPLLASIQMLCKFEKYEM
jgi:hypothetical protein